MAHLRLFAPAENRHSQWKTASVQKALSSSLGRPVQLRTEHCFHVVLEPNVSAEAFETEHLHKLYWLLSLTPFSPVLSKNSALRGIVKEIGPRLTFKTAYCTNALSAMRAARIEGVARIEKTTRYELDGELDDSLFLELAGDRMTEFVYPEHVDFTLCAGKADFFEVDILGNPENLDKANTELGLAFDGSDLEYYKELFVNKLRRNPTDVELFDLAQSDSEHSRHWFFRGKLVIDGKPREDSLMHTVRSTQEHSNPNNLIAFSDNSSAIEGFPRVLQLLPADPRRASELTVTERPKHIIYSAETHNFPTAVCPFQGATTGTGGRIRDIHATGRGAHEIAGVAGYSFGNLHLHNYKMAWEEEEAYPSGFSRPSQIAIEASNGASDYGNKFGEPVLCGFSRSFGQRLPNGERCEYVKPIMFSGGLGAIDEGQTKKEPCGEGMLLAKIGGPVYRIGVGGGAASSLSVQGSRESHLDFGAVQRGDAEMEQKLHRVVRACVEMGEENPILSIHDQGAGGNGNVLKELVEGGGAVIDADAFELGDETISCRELWTAEYQENDACLVDPSRVDRMMEVAKREKCRVSVVGTVSKDQRVVLKDYSSQGNARHPVDFDTKLLGEREKKTFHLSTQPSLLRPLSLPTSMTTRIALEMVLRLPSVASKRWLTCKVDRSVTGLVAQQQCVGSLHTPLADVAVVALSHFEKVGAAVAVGEQPIKGLLSPSAGARMTVAETLTNLVFAPITELKDVKMSGNWMWAAKCEGEGVRLVDACNALCQALKETGAAIDGGKDSLSMAAKAGGELVKAPGTLVLSAYAPCTDVTKVITPDLKGPQEDASRSSIIYVRLGSSITRHRLGGSALAQVLKQLGDDPVDVEDFSQLVCGFGVIQELIKEGKILSGHDVSDGGWVTALLEMAFAGNIQLEAQLDIEGPTIPYLFAEEAGVFLEIEEKYEENLGKTFREKGIYSQIVGKVTPVYGPDALITIAVNGEEVLKEKLTVLREVWEETGDVLGLQQTTAEALSGAKEVREATRKVVYNTTFGWGIAKDVLHIAQDAPRVAIIREEGSNGDREMAAAFTLTGFQTVDVTMTDMLGGHKLDSYAGLAFVGGFSYADVLGSAKGWAAAITFNKEVAEEFEKFRRRRDTFSFGVCNGCQLMALLGWVGSYENEPGVFLAENECGRFESSFGPVRIEPSKSVMLKGMEGSVLGLWSSHGEGRFTYRSQAVKGRLDSAGCIAVRYVDAEGRPTVQYPWNPNGSEDAVAAVCSEDGRHLALMPHSDRAFLEWQWADYPRQWRKSSEEMPVSPWVKMFRNAFDWVVSQ